MIEFSKCRNVKTQQEAFAVESTFSIITLDFTPDSHVIFHEILFFTAQRKMRRKIINGESLENSQENVYGRVHSGKVASILFTDFNSML